MLFSGLFDLNAIYTEKRREYISSVWNMFNIFRLFGALSPRASRIVPEELGVTGSLKRRSMRNETILNKYEAVDQRNDTFQLKLPIQDNLYTHRRLKVYGLDTENYGELIAARIAENMLLNKPNANLTVPRISFIYDKDTKKVLIASRYLQGENNKPAQTLTAYTRTQASKPDVRTKYFNYTNVATSDPKDVSVDILPTDIHKGMAEALVLSAILGDHDVNPGNMMVVEHANKYVIGRIDFGHAFNSLLVGPKAFGGQKRYPWHHILDYFNREHVASFPNVGQSKVWRNYSGLISSEEMCAALEAFSEDDIDLTSVRDEFLTLIDELNGNGDTRGLKHLQHTLARIYQNTMGQKLTVSKRKSAKESAQETLNTVVGALEVFVKTNCREAKDAAKIMRLQLQIDEVIKNNGAFGDNIREAFMAIEQSAAALNRNCHFRTNRVKQETKRIHWIKMDAKQPAFVGSLDQYIEHRRSVLKLSHQSRKIGFMQSFSRGNKRTTTKPPRGNPYMQ